MCNMKQTNLKIKLYHFENGKERVDFSVTTEFPSDIDVSFSSLWQTLHFLYPKSKVISYTLSYE